MPRRPAEPGPGPDGDPGRRARARRRAATETEPRWPGHWRQVTANNLKVMRLPTGSTMIRVRVSAWLRLRRLTGRLSYSVAGPAGEAWLKSSCRPGPEATPRPAHCARHQSPSHAALAIIMIALAHQPPGTRKGRRAAAACHRGRGSLSGRTRRNLKSPRRRRVREISRWSLLLGRLKLVRASPSGREPECQSRGCPGLPGQAAVDFEFTVGQRAYRINPYFLCCRMR